MSRFLHSDRNRRVASKSSSAGSRGGPRRRTLQEPATITSVLTQAQAISSRRLYTVLRCPQGLVPRMEYERLGLPQGRHVYRESGPLSLFLMCWVRPTQSLPALPQARWSPLPSYNGRGETRPARGSHRGALACFIQRCSPESAITRSATIRRSSGERLPK
jgi:hypothetical protein